MNCNPWMVSMSWRSRTLKASAAEMLQLYRDGNDIDAITRIISEKYGVPFGHVRADAEALLKKLE